MASILLVLGLLLGLLIIPFGFPGLWVMAGAVLVYSYAVPNGAISLWTVLPVAALAALGEVLELVLAGRFARRYGGSRRAGWGAILGSIVGAILGVPVPVIGSMLGAFAGAFVGAWLAEMSRAREVASATRVATGALLGRVAAVAAKIGIGMVIIVWVIVAVGVRGLGH